MKRISEAELSSDFSLHTQSRAAYVTFFCGLGGVICCLAIYLLLQNYVSELNEMKKNAKSPYDMTPDERYAFYASIIQKAQAVSNIAFPVFLSANLLWIIGGFAWSFDLRREPANRGLWKSGGLLVVITAGICCVGWYYLISRYLQGTQ